MNQSPSVRIDLSSGFQLFKYRLPSSRDHLCQEIMHIHYLEFFHFNGNELFDEF